MDKKNIYINEHLDLYGFDGQTDLQLLENILGKKAKTKIAQLLNTYEIDPEGKNYSTANIHMVASMPKSELMLKGLTCCEAERLASSVELGLRIATSNYARNLTKVSTPEESVKYLSPLIRNLPREVFTVVFLNSKNQIISNKTISVGSLTSSIVHPREVFLAAVTAKAAAIIVAHNHPSSDPTPSEEDKRVTRTLLEAGKIMLIPVLDHIIIGGNNYYSFAEHGYFNN